MRGGGGGGGGIIKLYCFEVKRLPRITLDCKLVSVQYREYEFGLTPERFVCFVLCVSEIKQILGQEYFFFNIL